MISNDLLIINCWVQELFLQSGYETSIIDWIRCNSRHARSSCLWWFYPNTRALNKMALALPTSHCARTLAPVVVAIPSCSLMFTMELSSPNRSRLTMELSSSTYLPYRSILSMEFSFFNRSRLYVTDRSILFIEFSSHNGPILTMEFTLLIDDDHSMGELIHPTVCPLASQGSFPMQAAMAAIFSLADRTSLERRWAGATTSSHAHSKDARNMK